MKRLGIIVMFGAILGLGGLADPKVVRLPPAEEEIAALRAALDGVAKVLEGFVVELKGAVGVLSANDQDLLAKYRAVAIQLKDLEAKVEAVRAECLNISTALAEQIAQLSQQLAALDKRITTLESYDIGNLSRRVLRLEQAIQAVQIKIENNREKIAALEKTIGGFTADISALKESVLKLETRVSDHDTRIATVEKTMEVNVKDIVGRLDMIQMLAILGLLAGIGAIVLILTGVGR